MATETEKGSLSAWAKLKSWSTDKLDRAAFNVVNVDIMTGANADFYKTGKEFAKLERVEQEALRKSVTESALGNVDESIKAFDVSRVAETELASKLTQAPATFKRFGGQAGYATSKVFHAGADVATTQFVKTVGVSGAGKGAALGVGAGLVTFLADRFINSDEQVDTGAIQGITDATKSATLGALGGLGTAAAITGLKNIKDQFSTETARQVFDIGREGTLPARGAAFMNRRLGSSIFMGAAALGSSAYIGGKILKSIISTSMTKPVDNNSIGVSIGDAF